MAVRIKFLLQSALDLLYPPHCESCQKPGSFFCRQCIKRIRWIRSPCCQVCSLPVSGRISRAFICTNCRFRKFSFQFAVCGCEADEVVRRLIHRFKYQGNTRLEGILSRLLFHAWRDSRIAANPPEFLVPVPLHPLRQRERGFNQAGILAKAHSQHTGIPCKSFLKRSLFTRSQTLLSRCQRRQNMRGAFVLRQNKLMNGAKVMLVDDVLTTGATLEECSKMLLAGGACAVSAITVVRA
jgi:ComF family protein